MDRAPIGHDPALVAPFALQDRVEQEVVLARPVAVDFVVRTHDRARLTALDRDLEGEQVAFAQIRFADLRVGGGAQRLLRVEREVLHRRDDVVRLHAADRFPGHDAREQRVLAEIFEGPPAPRIARQIDAAGEEDVKGLRARLRPDHRAAAIGEIGIEAGGEREAGGQRGRDIALALLDLIGDAEAGVAFPKRWDAEPGHAGNVAGRGNHVGGLVLRHRREIAVDVAQLLRGGHLVGEGAGAGFGCGGRGVACSSRGCILPGFGLGGGGHRPGQRHHRHRDGRITSLAEHPTPPHFRANWKRFQWSCFPGW